MRPIEFRGKRIDNGEWVKGFYFVIQDRAKTEHIIMTTDGEGPSMDYPYPQVWHNNIEVDPTTVGQFTGLQDKNGVDIFEGDIYRNCGGYYRTIYYSVEDAQFRARSVDKNYFGEYDSDHQIHETERFEVVVVANIHDTPSENKRAKRRRELGYDEPSMDERTDNINQVIESLGDTTSEEGE